MAYSDLNQRQRRFIDEYILTGCGSQAYRKAGYKDGNNHCVAVRANQLLTKLDIKAAISQRQQAADSDRLLSLVAKKEMLGEIALANQRDDPMVAIRAIAELNRMEGHYAPKPMPTTGNVTFIQQIGSPNEEHVVEAEVVDVVEVED